MRSGDRVTYEGGRHFVSIPMDTAYMGTEGWFAFRLVERVCKRLGILAEELEHRYTEENYGYIRAVFEVVPRV